MESCTNLMLDFESEFAAFLKKDFQDINNKVRGTSTLPAKSKGLLIGIDGTVQASDLSYDALVMTFSFTNICRRNWRF